MICPNCGKELPDNARICTSCKAVQRVFRRKHGDADIPEQPERVRVSRRIQPEQELSSELGKRDGERRKVDKPAAAQHGARDTNGYDAGALPIGLARQAARERGNVRHVRRAPDRFRHKIDAKPTMQHPPIYRKSHRKLLTILAVVLLVILFSGTVCGYILFKSEDGQRLMATWGWSVARTDAYVTLGHELIDQAYFTRALEKLQVAVDREPENVDALVLMAQAYTELGFTEDAVAIYESLIHDIAPGHPSAYRNLIKIYQQREYHAEALELMKLAQQNVSDGTQEFEVMLRTFTPATPALSHLEGRYNEEINLTITIPEGQTVYYTIDGTDPSESGMIYTQGTQIHIPEGKMTVKVIGFTENGTPSEQITADYTVIIPTPAAPKANYQSGVYKKAPKVSLRPGSEDKKENEKIVAIYYTIDGRQATTESTLFDPDNPIQLPIGKSRLRAIAVHENGKISYEMNVTYEVEGNLKKMFNEDDTFKNMTLYKTGYKTFTKNWGTPKSYEVLPQSEWYDPQMESYEAVYSWGTARFVIKTKDGSPVLYALDTTNAKMTAPRSTRVGMDGSDVVGKFQDLGQAELDSTGNRLLYNLNSGNYKFGTYRREADGNFAIHYYYPIGDDRQIFVELSYYLDEKDQVERIVWQRYLSELTEETQGS